MKALIGHTGFVGQSLKRQTSFDACFASRDIAGVAGQEYDLLVCSAAPAKKWIADRDPEADLGNIQLLAGHLQTAKAGQVILISTVDVFTDCRGRDESSPISEAGLSPYGRNRLWLERFVADHFDNVLIVRLVGLIGPGLRKNALFDLHNDNALQNIDARGRFQFYPMVNLWNDLTVAREAGLDLVHFVAEPLTVAEAARQGFGRAFDNRLDRPPADYDLRSRHAALFGGQGDFLYSARESLLAISAYAQSEPHSEPAA